MGMVCSSDFFNFVSDHILAPVDIVKIVDDGLVQHVDEQTTYGKIREVCKASREGSMTLNPSKLQVAQEVEFAGFMIGKDGIKAEPYKLATLHGTLLPKTSKSCARFWEQPNSWPSSSRTSHTSAPHSARYFRKGTPS